MTTINNQEYPHIFRMLVCMYHDQGMQVLPTQMIDATKVELEDCTHAQFEKFLSTLTDKQIEVISVGEQGKAARELRKAAGKHFDRYHNAFEEYFMMIGC